MNRFVLSLLLLCLANISAFSQLRIAAHAGIGQSLIDKLSLDDGISTSSAYSEALTYNVGATAYYQLSTSSLDLMAGLNYEFLSSEVDDLFPHDDGIVRLPWNEDFHRITLPIGINFRFDEWLQLYAGYLSYFNVAYSERKESPVYYPGNPIINFYSSGVTAGVNLVFYQRFLIGFNYSRELSYSIQFDEE